MVELQCHPGTFSANLICLLFWSAQPCSINFAILAKIVSELLNFSILLEKQGQQPYLKNCPRFFQFKLKIAPEFGNAPLEQLCLIFAGKIMKDHETLTGHNVKDGMTVHLVIKTGSSSAATSGNASSTAATDSSSSRPGKNSACHCSKSINLLILTLGKWLSGF